MKKISGRFQAWHALLILIVFNLILAFFIGDQYGQTWDEPSYYLYGERSYDAYMRGLENQPLIPEKHIYFLDLRYYGPFYTATGWKMVDALTPVLNTWEYYDLWHFVNFIFFQIALISMYFLSKRYLRPWTAFFVVLLFYTQPLLFGHAFINPKDMPFLTFFLASVTNGLYMTDSISAEPEDSQLSPKLFPQFYLFLSILFGLYVFTFVGKDLFHSVISWMISSMCNAPADTFLERLFSALVGSSNRLPVENYIHKAVAAHLERILLFLLFLALLGRKLYVDFSHNKKLDVRLNIDIRLWALTLGSGILLGLVTSIRLLAPFAGALVAGYALWKVGRKSIPILICYFSIAAVVSYLTWPFLWDSPLYNFFEALQVMRDFPFTGEVRFMGDNISPSNLPWFYLPFLISAQITEPVVLLAWIGFFVIISNLRNQIRKEYMVLIAWFVLPVGMQILLRSNIYDNFRQFLFVLPPMFVLAGLGLETLASRVTHQAAKVILICVCALPGLIGISSLHPVQYIYYNSLVGGVSGAEGDFELDYWLTSYSEAGEFINDNASQGANILAWGSGYNGARADLTIYSFSVDEDIAGFEEPFEYAVVTTRFFSHLAIFKDAPVVYEVRKNGALLAVVKKLTK